MFGKWRIYVACDQRFIQEYNYLIGDINYGLKAKSWKLNRTSVSVSGWELTARHVKTTPTAPQQTVVISMLWSALTAPRIPRSAPWSGTIVSVSAAAHYLSHVHMHVTSGGCCFDFSKYSWRCYDTQKYGDNYCITSSNVVYNVSWCSSGRVLWRHAAVTTISWEPLLYVDFGIYL